MAFLRLASSAAWGWSPTGSGPNVGPQVRTEGGAGRAACLLSPSRLRDHILVGEGD